MVGLNLSNFLKTSNTLIQTWQIRKLYIFPTISRYREPTYTVYFVFWVPQVIEVGKQDWRDGSVIRGV